MRDAVKERSKLGNARLPAADLTSEYMGMCLWAWTPKRWRERVKFIKGFKALGEQDTQQQQASNEFNNEFSNEFGNEAAANDAEAATPVIDAESALRKRIGGFRRFNQRLSHHERQRTVDVEAVASWFKTLKQANEELSKLAALDRSEIPVKSGDGSRVLFQAFPGGGGSLVLPRKAPGSRRSVEGSPCLVANGGSSGRGGRSKVASSTLSLHLGDEGCGVGLAAWQRLLSEHGIGKDGRPLDSAAGVLGNSNTVFAESSTGRYIPRAILAGFGGSGFDGACKAGIFSPASFSQGKYGTWTDEDTGSESLLDSWYCGREFGEAVFESVRRHMEQADAVSGMVLTHSTFESPASGNATDTLLRRLSCEYGKKHKFSLCGNPGIENDGSEERKKMIFNFGMSWFGLMEHLDVVSFYDRPSLMKLASSKVNGLGLSSPTVEDCQGLVGRLVGALTAPQRLGAGVDPLVGSRTMDLKALATNLLPYPRIHFMMPSLGGLGGEGDSDGCDAVTAALTSGAMCCAGLSSDMPTIARSLLCSGMHQFAPLSSKMAFMMDTSCKWVDWNRVGMTLSAFNDPKRRLPQEVACFSNNCAMGDALKIWKDELDQLDRTHTRKWGIEVTPEKGDLEQAQEELHFIVRDYAEVATETGNGDDEEEEEE
eukprot:TRINITY_DN77248_c0_g1_i1.p1 TRINITY_DN77248_c0_g1~~TRINITY_DN77248_c0_g1_i1.p1  ORF type:complete len:744 (+),score=160.16 TRINITY_DN77248_c0_g1_i1:268-2232(+)